MMSSSSFKCGCVVDFDFVGWNNTLRNVEIDYCPRHKAADALYDALEFAKTEAVAITQCDESWEPYGIALMIRDRAAATLALADGEVDDE